MGPSPESWRAGSGPALRHLTRLLACGLALVLAAGCSRRPPPPRLVLLVTVDTLRADHVGAYGNPHGLTPHLDALARQAVLFERAYTPVPFTLSAVAAAMTSRYPEEIGVLRNRSVVPAGPPTLAGWLGARGWRTGAVVSNFVLREESGIHRGFSRFDARLTQRESVRGVPERTAGPTTEAALALLDDLRRGPAAPVFLWVHYQDPHGPYTPPDPPGRGRFEALARSAPDALRVLPLTGNESGQGGIPSYQFLEGRTDPASYRAAYMGEVAHTDAMVGRLLEGLASRGLDGETAVLFTADHGEGLGEEDYWFAHGERLLEPLVHVPLLVRAPGLRPGRRDDVASLLDLFPTVAGLAGGQAPESCRGRDLLDPGRGRKAGPLYLSNIDRGRTRRRALLDHGLKYVRHKGEGEESARETLVVLGTDAPNLATSRPGDLEAARRAYAGARATVGQGRAEQRQLLAPADEEKLRALGYVGGQ